MVMPRSRSFRSVIDRVKRTEDVMRVVLRQTLRDRRRQRRFAVVNVTHRPNVYVRLAPVKLFLAHDSLRIPCY